MRKSIQKLFVFSVALLSLTACTHLFLFPDRINYFPDAQKWILYDEGAIQTPDGETLDYWFLPAQKNKIKDPNPKGLIIQVHGNAQNLSSHVKSLGWLAENGYNLAAFDYRGYGRSTGSRDPWGTYRDVVTALDYFTLQKNPHHLPVYFYGQSLGGTLLLKAVSAHPGRWHPAMVIIESSFYSYRGIATEKLAESWLTWPLQWLGYVLVGDRLSLKADELKTISPIPTYLFYSEKDPIVPIHWGDKIFRSLGEPKKFFSYPERAHIAAMWVEQGKFRDVLLRGMAENRKCQSPF